MRIVIFGTGKIYHEWKTKINSEDEVVALLDNDKDKWNQIMDGISILNPQDIIHLKYEKIVLMSAYALDMKKQLLEYGCLAENIMHCEEYFAQCQKMELSYYSGKEGQKGEKKHCAILCNSLGYHGGAMTAFYAALALQECNIAVDIIAEEGNAALISEINKRGISIIICPNLAMAKWNSLRWVEEYDYVIVNTMPMILCALEIAKYKSVIMWLHDSDNIYEYMNYWKNEIIHGLDNQNLQLYAVSKVARDNFCRWIQKHPISILPCGIPDDAYTCRIHPKLIFSIIGSIHPIKGHDIMLQAFKKLPTDILEQVEFWIIGKDTDSDFYQSITQSIEEVGCVKLIGEVEKEELNQLYSQIDVIVIPSRKETLSLVAIEAMLHGIVCMVSDAAGIAEYVQDGENGLRFISEDVDSLAEKVRWCIENRDNMRRIKAKARTLYEQHFSMNIFKKNLLHILEADIM